MKNEEEINELRDMFSKALHYRIQANSDNGINSQMSRIIETLDWCLGNELELSTYIAITRAFVYAVDGLRKENTV